MVYKSESIVIIDDDPDVMVTLSERLKKSGYSTEQFTDSADAVRRIREIRPDLVISDINMPGLNGFEVYNLIRDNRGTKHIPIIMITGISEARKQATTMNAEDTYYLSKPVSPSDLLKVVKIALDPAANF